MEKTILLSEDIIMVIIEGSVRFNAAYFLQQKPLSIQTNIMVNKSIGPIGSGSTYAGQTL